MPASDGSEFHGTLRAEFRANGVDEQNVRRWRRADRASSWPAIVVLAVGVIVFRDVSSPQAIPEGAIAGPEDAGRFVRGDRILILFDNSGSVTGDANKMRSRAEQIASLRQQHPIAGERTTNGFAIQGAGSSWDMVGPLEEEVARLGGIDTVYFISDFDGTDANDDTGGGYSTLIRLLQTNRIRLYLSTVRNPPPLRDAQIAADSGGGVVSIPVRGNPP